MGNKRTKRDTSAIVGDTYEAAKNLYTQCVTFAFVSSQNISANLYRKESSFNMEMGGGGGGRLS